MAYLHSPSLTTLKHNPKPACFPPSKPSSLHNLCCFTTQLRSSPHRCNALFGEIPENLLETTLHLDQFPPLQHGFMQFERITEELSETQKWGFLVFAGITWIYLTVRPGILISAIDAYLLAPLKLGLDSLTGRRRLKRTGFVIREKLGEGSFGVVYSGAVAPKNVNVEENLQRRGRGRAPQLDERFKEKVILKKTLNP
ncbi:serine/threonine-protein kinase STN8, chloroplastic-like [Pyrus x bretschneideri]|uniref:serine/threonine-protein kinase STN8, chloroplastic-like n=1 Tax=Pyrus x bretschneideri TaxID=225117 RepID=UPI00202FDC3F|nr:serine/threonine-protein kinase STN8, chloroplastic-like [Pyrus x bretschneideri]